MIVSSFHSFVTKPAGFFWNNRGWRWHSDSQERSMDAGDVQDSAGVQPMEFGSEAFTFWWFYVGNGWVAGGRWDDEITSDEMDDSRKFPA